MTLLLQNAPLRAPEHHPTIETLAEYAAGQSRPGFDVVLAAHLRGCAQCRRDAAQLEAVGGGLLETIAPAALDRGALAATLDRLDEPQETLLRPTRSLDQLLAGARRRWIAPGTWVAPINTPHDPADRVFLLCIGAGKATAQHGHDGAELTQVLGGALADNGIIYRAGDIVEQDVSHTHHPQVSGDTPCICLVATQGRLKATTLIGQIAFALAGV